MALPLVCPDCCVSQLQYTTGQERRAVTQATLPLLCAACGQPLVPGKRFCADCGAPVPAPGSSVPAPSPPPLPAVAAAVAPRPPAAAAAGTPADDRGVPEAERRQLTVLFCD